jgi:hypothetical protein
MDLADIMKKTNVDTIVVKEIKGKITGLNNLVELTRFQLRQTSEILYKIFLLVIYPDLDSMLHMQKRMELDALNVMYVVLE